MTTIDIVCLGVGKGASYVLKGQPSTGFALRVNHEPYMLIDCGAGVALSYLRNIGGALPNTIYISHNHMDHTGDLPIVIGVTPGKPRLLGNSTVLDFVRTHRLHGAPELNAALDDRAEWVTPNEDNRISLEYGLSLELFRSVHSYICYGFVLSKSGQQILGYPADTAFNENIYARVTNCPVAILDAREIGNHDHASFQDVEQFATTVPNCAMWVVHYEESSYRFMSPNVRFLREGDVIKLYED